MQEVPTTFIQGPNVDRSSSLVVVLLFCGAVVFMSVQALRPFGLSRNSPPRIFSVIRPLSGENITHASASEKNLHSQRNLVNKSID